MTYSNKTEAILSVFDIDNKNIDIQQTYSPLDNVGRKEYDINTSITGNIPYHNTNKIFMSLEDETVGTDLSLLSVDLFAKTITKTAMVETDILKLCASDNKACRVDAAGNVYDLITGELYTTIGSTNRNRISNVMDDNNNSVIYLSNDGNNIISQGENTLIYPLASGITLGSGEVFGLVGEVLVYAATYLAPTRRVLYIIHA